MKNQKFFLTNKILKFKKPKKASRSKLSESFQKAFEFFEILLKSELKALF